MLLVQDYFLKQRIAQGNKVDKVKIQSSAPALRILETLCSSLLTRLEVYNWFDDDGDDFESTNQAGKKHKVDESFGEYCRAAVFSDVVNSDGRLLAK